MLFLQKALSALPSGLSSVQVKTRLACFSFLLLKFVFAAHFCASEFSLPELRLFVLLRRTSFQESSGSVYYSIFDFQGSVLQKVFRFILAGALIFLSSFRFCRLVFCDSLCILTPVYGTVKQFFAFFLEFFPIFRKQLYLGLKASISCFSFC